MTTTQLFTTLLLSIMDGLKIAVCYNLCIKNKLFLMMQCHIANRPHQMALGLCVEIKRCVVLGWKAMVFPAVMYGCDSWTLKKAEH